MLRSFNIKNFRCFQHFTLASLERINLIAGKNNVGKTSLLEAIFIFINPTNPESLLLINRLRGLTKLGIFKDIEEMRGFFFNQDIDTVIELSSLEENQLNRSIDISFSESEESQIPQRSLSYEDDTAPFKPSESLTTEVRSWDRLVMEYKDPTNKKSPLRTSLTAGRNVGLLKGRSRRERFPLGIYLTVSTRSPIEDLCFTHKSPIQPQIRHAGNWDGDYWWRSGTLAIGNNSDREQQRSGTTAIRNNSDREQQRSGTTAIGNNSDGKKTL
ncbi:MAG: ATP/GTP-binding protein [Xenococcaceae cyanobacterium]